MANEAGLASTPAIGAERMPFVVIAGYGLPGRMLADKVRARKIDYIVIELNAQTVARALRCDMRIMVGDARDAETLRRAGVERATLVALMVPDDAVSLTATSNVRALNSTAVLITRCAYTSTGIEAVRRGANHVLVAEQVIANELDRITGEL